MMKKRVLSLISVAILLFGMSLSIYAADDHSGHDLQKEIIQGNNVKHRVVCCTQSCKDDNGGDPAVVGEENHNWLEDSSGHFRDCTECGYRDIITPCDPYPGWSLIDDSNQHFRICRICQCGIDGTFGAHDTKGENGGCSVCGYGTHTTGTVSEEHSKESIPEVNVIEKKIQEEEAYTINDFSHSSIPSSMISNVPSNAYNMSAICTTQGFVSGFNKIVQANPSSASVAVYSETPLAFNEKMMDAIRLSNRTFTYVFRYQGHVYSIVIPAGKDITPIVTDGAFAGPLYIGAKLGTTVLIK